MSQTQQAAQTPQTTPTPQTAPAPRAAIPRQPVVPSSRREQGRKRRTAFLRRFRACGEVKRAAEGAGIAHATLYRWRMRNEDFRESWDSVADQRRFALEDRMMQLACDGEKSAVFHKGEQVGWRVSHTVRAALAMLAYLDRREKARLEAEKRASESHFSSVSRDGNAQSAGFDDDEDYDDQDEVDEVEEVEEEEEEKEAASVAPASVRPDVPPVPPVAPIPPAPTGKRWVRIVNQPFYNNIRLCWPGEYVELADKVAFNSVCMEELKPGEVVPASARRF